MKAILSDIHGNLEALHAVLEDSRRHRVEAVYCLGDLVGYGPNPRECVDLAMTWKVALQGKFDRVILDRPPNLDGWATAHAAAHSIVWSQDVLEEVTPDKKAWDRRWGFLHRLKPQHDEGELLFVHGSARSPLDEYVFPEDVYNPAKMLAIFALIRRHCFCGHTHVPGLITEDLRYVEPADLTDGYRLGRGKAVVNVGSVGQPRDGDARACYALLDGDLLRWRRVEYDVETTVRKIREIDALADWLGDRLREGR